MARFLVTAALLIGLASCGSSSTDSGSDASADLDAGATGGAGGAGGTGGTHTGGTGGRRY